MSQHTTQYSASPDPYSMEHYPQKFQVRVGPSQQTHDARELAKAAFHRHMQYHDQPHAAVIWQNMYRQPISPLTMDDIHKKIGYRKVDGVWYPKRVAKKLRYQKKIARLAAEELATRPVRDLTEPRRLLF